MTDLLTRSVELRADAETGVVEGIAVPWNTRTSIAGLYEESFERGSITGEDVKLFWQHNEVIGKITASEDRDEGFWISAQISDTTQGRDARVLLKDGVVDRFSVGFRPLEHREEEDGNLIVRTKVDLKEVSAVTFPAYSDAKISQVRSDLHNEQEPTVADAVITPEDLAEVRETVEDLDRRFSTFTVKDEAPVADTRSAGAILKGIAAGDESAERAYTGGTTADLGSTLKPTWIGDLTRLIDAPSPLRSVFAKGALPAEGMSLEYGVLDVDSSAAGVQAKEGDNLVYGKVTVKSATAPIATLGGYTQLSFQEIQRSSVNILDLNLRGQAIALGKVLDTRFRSAFNDAVTASVTAGRVITADADKGGTVSATEYLSAIVDAAGIFQDNGLGLDALIVNTATFKAILNLTDSTGRPMFLITGDGVNNIGAVNVTGLSGNLAGLRVILDPKGTNNAFVNFEAIREYNSPVVKLQDTNIINLSQDFSVYTYSALAPEIPAGIVKLA